MEIKSLKSEPGSKPKAIPGFSVNVILKKSPMTGFGFGLFKNNPSNLIFRKGIDIPLI
jgi:hypothetical protein